MGVGSPRAGPGPSLAARVPLTFSGVILMKKVGIAGLAVVALAALGGCAAENATCKPGDANAKPAAGMANASCPMMPDHAVEAGAVAVSYKGQNVGFCCDGCIPKWNKMTDAQKDESLKKVAAK